MSESQHPEASTERTAAECPNCHTDNDDETDCPHLLAGDECPVCGHDLSKPPAGKVSCDHCQYVVNGRTFQELADFNLTVRQGKRFLEVFADKSHTTPGNIENGIRTVCYDHGIERDELNDLLDDLRGRGEYRND